MPVIAGLAKTAEAISKDEIPLPNAFGIGMTAPRYFQVKKILVVLIVIPVIFWVTWLVFPKTSMQSLIDDSIRDGKLEIEVEGLEKGLFYNMSVERLVLKSSGE